MPCNTRGAAVKQTLQQDGNFRFIAGDVTAAKARTLELPMLTVCGCGESHYGRAAAGIAWAKAHRNVYHPERVDRGQKARQAAAKGAPTAVASFGEREL